MNGYLLEIWIVFPSLKTLRCVLFVLGCDIAGDACYTAGFLLCALEDDLHPVTFCFLSHNFKN